MGTDDYDELACFTVVDEPAVETKAAKQPIIDVNDLVDELEALGL